MSKEYFMENISGETLAKLIDETLTYEKNKKSENIKTRWLRVVPVAAAVAFVITAVSIISHFTQNSVIDFTPPDLASESVINPQSDNPSDTGDAENKDRIWGDVFNILLVGIDDAAYLTDTMMIVSFNVKDSTASVMNIPRDTYVKTEHYSGKINSVYLRGYNIARNEGLDGETSSARAIKDLSDMITYTLGIPVDRYVAIDTAGFRFLVDEIGGIDMEVPIRMKYTDPYQDLYIDLQPGWQHLDGSQAEQLVRFRQGDPNYPDYVYGHLDRIKTQQQFMAVLAKKLLGGMSLKNINTLFELEEKYMTTNIAAGDAGWFALKALDVSFDDIRVHTLPGTWLSSVSHYEIYKEETIEIINRYYNPFTEDIPESNFNIYDDNIDGGYKPEINIDGTTFSTLIQ